MAQWRIKEISDLTKISVRTLHHYDKIGLLKSSMRESNGYRWYSEGDLAKLQQIIALKFFGFSLGQIKTMLQQELSINEHLTAQKEMLAEQAEHLQQAQDAIGVVLEQNKSSKSLDWNNLITVIERYRMTQELKKTWAGKLNKEDQANYIKLKQEFTKEMDAWEKAMEAINNNQAGDPEEPEGQRVVKICLDAIKAIQEFEKKHKKPDNISNSKILNSMKEHYAKNIPLTPEGNLWYAKAANAYTINCWEELYNNILKNIDKDPESAVGKKIASQWRELIKSHCMGTSPDFWLGAMMWKDAAKAKSKMQDLTEIKPDLEEARKTNIDLFFNPKAIDWIQRALSKH